jgi:dihydrofolate synthase/folylpolyglutamate synthase
MTYNQTIEYLYSRLPAYHRIGKAAYKSNLDNINKLDEYFNHPHTRYKTIHIAGTNGKGSVSHMLASVLHEAGYKTGLYTSPHLKDFRERIKVNGDMIPKREVTAFIRKHRRIIDKVNPSFFEMTVALAFDYFSRVNVDVAVIETGLGGRLDSTNIITPVLSIITNIGHDHMDLLGNTLEKVAAEKAGIIKDNIPVVIGETQQRIKNIFISYAAGKGSDIYFTDDKYRCRLDKSINLTGERHFEVEYCFENRKISGIIPLGGDYQIRNLQTLFQSFDILKHSFDLSEIHLMNGINNTVLNTGLKGRWQILDNKPLTVCDTGHNMEGLEYVIRQIKGIQKTGLHIVLGFVNDKDISTILSLFPTDAVYYFTRASVPRALDEKILASRASDFGLKGECYPDVRKALRAARRNASDSDMIFIGGSTFIVAEVI